MPGNSRTSKISIYIPHLNSDGFSKPQGVYVRTSGTVFCAETRGLTYSLDNLESEYVYSKEFVSG